MTCNCTGACKTGQGCGGGMVLATNVDLSTFMPSPLETTIVQKDNGTFDLIYIYGRMKVRLVGCDLNKIMSVKLDTVNAKAEVRFETPISYVEFKEK